MREEAKCSVDVVYAGWRSTARTRATSYAEEAELDIIHAIIYAHTPSTIDAYNIFSSMSAWIACRQSAQHRSGTSSAYSYPSLQLFAFPLKLFQVINIKHMRTHSSLFTFTSMKTYVWANINSHIVLCVAATADCWYLVCVCVCVVPTGHIVGDRAHSVHTYCLFNLSQRFSLSQHNANASVVILTNAFSQCCSMSSVCGPFAFFCHFIIAVDWYARCGATVGMVFGESKSSLS